MWQCRTYHLRAFQCLVAVIHLALFSETVSSRFYEFGRRPVSGFVTHISRAAVSAGEYPTVRRQSYKPHHIYLDKRFSNKDFVQLSAVKQPQHPTFERVIIYRAHYDQPFTAKGYTSLHLLRSPPGA